MQVPTNRATLAPPDDPLDETESASGGETKVNPLSDLARKIGDQPGGPPPASSLSGSAPPPPPPPVAVSERRGGDSLAGAEPRRRSKHIHFDYALPQLHASFRDKLVHTVQWATCIAVFVFVSSLVFLALSFVFTFGVGMLTVALNELLETISVQTP